MDRRSSKGQKATNLFDISNVRPYVYERGTVAKKYYCVRFFFGTVLLASRKLGDDIQDQESARIVAEGMKLCIDFRQILKTRKDEEYKQFTSDEFLRDGATSDFVLAFWDPQTSDYLIDRKNAGHGLSEEYVRNRRRYTERFVVTWEGFQTPLRLANSRLVQRFVRHLIDKLQVKKNLVEAIMKSLQRPLMWAFQNNLLDRPFYWETVTYPKSENEERGVFSKDQTLALLNLPVTPMKLVSSIEKNRAGMISRSQLKKVNKNGSVTRIDIRIKAVLALAIATGLRRGEIRGLKWSDINFDKKTLRVERSFVRLEGEKQPKGGACGLVPVPDSLFTILRDLEKTAKELNVFGPSNFVLFSGSTTRPISAKTIQRGFERAMTAIGVTPDERKEKRLVLHSGRHYFAMVLDRGLGETQARMLTRHKTREAFQGYSEHLTHQDIEGGRRVMNEALADDNPKLDKIPFF